MRSSRRLEDSGLRAVFAYGFPWWGKWEERQPSWFVRAATEHFSTQDQMLTLALAAPGPEFTDFEVTRDHWKLAREAGARITTHVGVGSYGLDAKLERFGRAGAARSRHHLHPLHDAQRHRDPDDRRHRRHGLAGGAGRDDDGSWHAADPEVPRPRSEARASASTWRPTSPATCSTRCDRCSRCSARWRRAQGKAPITRSRRPGLRDDRGRQGQRARRARWDR